MEKTLKLFILISAIYAAISFTVIRRFPPLNPDEIIVAVNSFNFSHGHGIRYSLYDDIFTPSAYPLRDLSNHISRKGYESWAALWTFSRNPWLSRASAGAAGLLVLIIFFFWGSLLFDRRFGLTMAMLFLTSPLFWLGSLVINEHLLLLAGLGVMLGLATVDPTHYPRALPFSGFLGGLLLIVHQNVLLFIPGWIFFILLAHPTKPKRFSPLLHALTGLTIGGLLAFISVDWPRFLLFQKTMYWRFANPPLFVRPWTPVQWVKDFGNTLWNGPTYYINTVHVHGWQTSLHGFWLGIALAMTVVVFNKEKVLSETARHLRALTVGLLATSITMILLMPRQEALYDVLLFPFLIPLAAYGIRRSMRTPYILRIGIGSLLSAGLLSFVIYGCNSVRLYKSYGTALAEVKQWVPDSSLKIAGPCVLWFGFEPAYFRDSAGVIISRYYTGGAWNLKEWLGNWKPDILIVDDMFRHVFLPQGGDAVKLGLLLGASARLEGKVENGTSYGTWDIYRITWPQSSAGYRKN